MVDIKPAEVQDEDAPPPGIVPVEDDYPILTLASLKKVVGGSLPRVIDIFRQMDADNSGHVDVKEFVKGMRGAFPKARKEDCVALFDECDIDGGGTVQYEELVKMMRIVQREESAALASQAKKGAAPKSARTGSAASKNFKKNVKATSSGGALSSAGALSSGGALSSVMSSSISPNSSQRGGPSPGASLREIGSPGASIREVEA